jgi:hypothetical protein
MRVVDVDAFGHCRGSGEFRPNIRANEDLRLWTSKKTDPDKRTAERTSDNASVLMDMTPDIRPRLGVWR